MNARQAKRVVLWMNGHYLIAADHYGLSDEEADSLSESDLARLGEAQRALGLELLKRSGMDPHLEPERIVSAVLGRTDERGDDE